MTPDKVIHYSGLVTYVELASVKELDEVACLVQEKRADIEGGGDVLLRWVKSVAPYVAGAAVGLLAGMRLAEKL